MEELYKEPSLHLYRLYAFFRLKGLNRHESVSNLAEFQDCEKKWKDPLNSKKSIVTMIFEGFNLG